MARRTLTRRSKDKVIMRQFGRCGYCKAEMTDSAQTDHMDENCANDRWENLIACCCNCHGDKTQHYRKKREDLLRAMLETGRQNKLQWEQEWAEDDDHYGKLPDWLKERVKVDAVQVYAARRRASTLEVVDMEQFRYRPRRERGSSPCRQL